MNNRICLLGSVSALAMGVMIAPAFAQDTIETVVVTGMRASLQSAQAIKQNSDQVVDAITAVDIGALPDNSVAEALQRVPGIQITRTDVTNDPLRWAGYGNGVFVRGLSWVKSLTNGEESFGIDGRSISFADVSADLMSGVDVYKNPSAKMIEGGVGGTVDLKTRKPFDKDGRIVAISGNLSMGQLSNHATPQINALYSDRFNTGIGEIGVLLSADYQLLMSSNNVVSLDPWSNTFYSSSSSTAGTSTAPHYYPMGYTNSFGMIGYRHMDWKQPRVALDATLQWRPTEALEIALTGLFSKAEPQSAEHNVAWEVPSSAWTAGIGSSANYASYDATNAAKSIASYTYDDKGYWNGGTLYNAQSNSTQANYFDTRFDARHHINKTVELNVKYNPSNNLSVTLDANYVDSREYMYSMTVYNMVKNNAYRTWSSGSGWGFYFPTASAINIDVDLHDGSPSLTYNEAGASVLADKSNYLWAAATDHYENSNAHAYVTRADATYTFDDAGLGGWVKAVDVGFRSSLKEAVTRKSPWRWGRIGYTTWSYGGCSNGNATGTTAARAAALAACGAAIPTFTGNQGGGDVTLYDFPDMFGKSMPSVWEPTMSWIKDPRQVWASVQTMMSASRSVGVNGNLWNALAGTAGNCNTVLYKCNSIYSGVGASATSGISDQKEDTYAGYMQLDYAHDTLFGADVPVDGNIGVRIVRTNYDSGAGYLTLPTLTPCATTATNCTDRKEAAAFVGNPVTDSLGTITSYGGLSIPYASITHSYTNVLPSFNLRAHLSDTLQFRAAYSQGLVRPDLEKMRNYASVGFNFGTSTTSGTSVIDNTGAFSATNPKSGSASNPYLKPMYSQNYDISFEWFFAPTGNLSVALFHKTLSNYVKSGSAYMTLTNNNIEETFNVSTYVNGKKGHLQGLEISYQQFFDALPGAWSGLGVQANYTKLYNSGGSNSIGSGYFSNTTVVHGNNMGDVQSNYANAKLPMEGMSNDSYNAALMYEKYGVSARVAYNWRSSFLVNSYAVNLFQPVFQRNYGQVDSSVLYTFLDHYKVGLQVNNLFKQTTILQIGQTTDSKHDFEWVEGERKLSLVFRANW